MMKIAKNTVVSVHYTVTAEGVQVDSSAGGDPLVYLHGAKNMIPGLEKEMEGKSAGDAFKVEVRPEEAYGAHQPELIQTVPRSNFQGVEDLEPGMIFQAETSDGSTRRITIAAVEGDEVQVDANHPLAGKVLQFDIEVVNVREATAEEIAHGHSH